MSACDVHFTRCPPTVTALQDALSAYIELRQVAEDRIQEEE